MKGFDAATGKPSYYVRLGSLSSKLRKRAYNQAIAKVQDAKQRSQESISELRHTVDLVGLRTAVSNYAGEKSVTTMS